MSKASLRKAMYQRTEAARPRRVYVPPNDAQLESFVLTEIEHGLGGVPTFRAFQAAAVREALKHPAVKQRWLNRHRQLQEIAWADEARMR